MFRLAILLPTLALFASPPAAAGTIVVSKGGPIATIQAGVNAALAGDTVAVQDGVYQENVVVPAGKNGLHLLAAGKVVIEARKSGGLGGGPGLTIQASSVLLQGLVIRNARENASGNENGDGIRVLGEGFVAQNCRIASCENEAVFVNGVGNIQFKSCTLEYSVIGLRAVSASGLVLSKCTLRGARDAGVQLESCPGARFTKCSFQGCGNDGGIETVQAPTDGIVVKQCTFSNGIGTDVGIEGSGTEILGCSFTESRGGVSLGGGSVTVRDNHFENLRDDASAVFLDECDGSTVEANQISECADSAMFIRDCLDVVVRGNVAKNCTYEGESAFDSTVGSQVVFEDNSVTDCAGSGFRVDGPQCVLRSNHVKRCTLDGLFVTATATATLIDDNLVERCGAEGIDHRGAGSTITNNVFKKCRLDFTNVGTAVFQNNVFTSGGTSTPFEID